MRIPISKLKAIILYFCDNTNSRFLGKVKLMKLFYFLDFVHLKKYGVTVTGDDYYHLEHGPIPSMIKNLIDEVDYDIDNASLADTIKIEKREGLDMHRIIATRNFNTNDKKLFSESELKILESICTKFKDSNTKNIKDISHNESPWKNTEFLDKIPYELACNDKDCKFSKEEISLLQSI